jgi:hypothetical protein
MELNEKLTLWGAMHAAAREAALAATANDADAEAKRRQAQALRERADRLHREIYRELGAGRALR